MPTKTNSTGSTNSTNSINSTNSTKSRTISDFKMPIKKDGSPDERYTTPQFVKKDGTRDMRTLNTNKR
jgi:hypothetical protein